MMRALLIGVVKGYRLILSPWLGSACRLSPPAQRILCKPCSSMALLLAVTSRCAGWYAATLGVTAAAIPCLRNYRRGMRLFSRLNPSNTQPSSPKKSS